MDEQDNVLRTLKEQLSSGRGSRYIEPDPVYNSPQDILLDQCILGLSVKRDSFDELSSRAQNLIETVMLHPNPIVSASESLLTRYRVPSQF